DNITDSITLDCEMMSSYTNINGVLVSANSKVRNTLPTLMPGENEIAWIGNVSKIEISPRWWTL
ncbi:phage tail protein, partial [Listeria monocytogenes]|nr:phage tail protein [Listeria monocytogenes]